jgi:pimeloyl-ACP methyl ester carboxylesterase
MNGPTREPIAKDSPMPADRNRSRECAKLVHGFMANRLLLSLLGQRIRSHGFQTEAWGYTNMLCSLMVHANLLAKDLERMDALPDLSTIHLVTHSMGCIIARAALDQYRPVKLGRFVMLAPPNHGSFFATLMAPIAGGLCTPLRELSTDAGSLVNRLPLPRDLEIGVIAAGRDVLVSQESTRLDVPHEYASIPCLHSMLLFRSDAAKLVVEFLEHGRFPRSDSAPQSP